MITAPGLFPARISRLLAKAEFRRWHLSVGKEDAVPLYSTAHQGKDRA